jgi:hypothetical protein
MPATLKLTREGFSIELPRGTFEIAVDGRSTGSIEHGDTVNEPVEPGHHTLQIRHGRYSSRKLSFDGADGEVVSFRCYGANLWPLWLVSFALPNIGIWLKRE